jgi:hypothetical protein
MDETAYVFPEIYTKFHIWLTQELFIFAFAGTKKNIFIYI